MFWELEVGSNLSVSFFIITNLAQDEQQIIRYSAFLRGTESAWQALSYGLGSLTVFATVGSIYLNFALWAISIFPAWLVVRHFGVDTAPLARQEDLQGPRKSEDPRVNAPVTEV